MLNLLFILSAVSCAGFKSFLSRASVSAGFCSDDSGCSTGSKCIKIGGIGRCGTFDKGLVSTDELVNEGRGLKLTDE